MGKKARKAMKRSKRKKHRPRCAGCGCLLDTKRGHGGKKYCHACRKQMQRNINKMAQNKTKTPNI